MVRVPVISWKRRCAAAAEDDLGGKPLPASYMSEYSVLGFFVEDVNGAARVLREGGFSLEKGSRAKEILVDGPGDLLRISQVLREHGIQSEIADLVDGVYQG